MYDMVLAAGLVVVAVAVAVAVVVLSATKRR